MEERSQPSTVNLVKWENAGGLDLNLEMNDVCTNIGLMRDHEESV